MVLRKKKRLIWMVPSDVKIVLGGEEEVSMYSKRLYPCVRDTIWDFQVRKLVRLSLMEMGRLRGIILFEGVIEEMMIGAMAGEEAMVCAYGL